MAKAPAKLDAGLLSVPKGGATAQSAVVAPVVPVTASVRPGLVALTLRITPELHETLRRMSFEQRRPIQAIIMDRLADLL